MEKRLESIEKRMAGLEKNILRLANQQQELSALIIAEKTGLITVMAASKLSFYSESTIRGIIRRKEISVYRPTKHRVFIDWEEFCTWLKRRSTVPKTSDEPNLFGKYD